jgi:glycosyltransferase involved in cell wall biosynthesis
MASSIGTILKQCFRDPKELYNCLSFPTHERYQSNLKDTKCNYWLLQGTPGVKGNGWIQKYAQMPRNHYLLEKVDSNDVLRTIPNWVEFDFTLGQHRFGQVQTALQITNYLGCPSIALEHTTVTNSQLEKAAPELRKLRADINVFITKQSALAWGWELNDPSVRIIEHGINTEFFRPLNTKKENRVLAIHNDWINRGEILGWDIFNRVIINNGLSYRIVGDTAGLSQPSQNEYDLLNEYNKSTIYFNTSRTSPLPTSAAEAMACGLPIVTTDNYLLGEIVINGFNGYKTNSEEEQLRHIRRLLMDEGERKELGKNARQTIIDRFSMKAFTDNWNKVFEEVSKIRK